MKDLLIRVIGDEPNPLQRRNKAREYLQARILLSLQDHGAFANWAFVGGTALRFLFNLPRYSEDLDFSFLSPEAEAQFSSRLGSVKADLEAEAYDVDIRVREHRTVVGAWVRFRSLLYEIGASAHREETLSVKVEMDTHPPAGAVGATRILRRHFLLNLLHYDRASLFAGKLHAVLSRKYTKGRDLYDLAWYLAAPEWPAPNLVWLNNALAQTGWAGPVMNGENWKSVVLERLRQVEWRAARDDVRPFLERSRDESLLTLDSFQALLG